MPPLRPALLLRRLPRAQSVRAPFRAARVYAPFTTAARYRAPSLLPDTPDPAPREAESHDEGHVTQRTELSMEDYHRRADELMETLYTRLEKRQEESGDVDAEYHDGVMNIDTPKIGTFVINKQPPSRQIWLSSPISGPKRFDFVLVGESMHQKEGGGSGDWVYLRDGTSLSKLLKKEIGVDIEAEEMV
ncbi:Frataxin [Trichodelitschia bisporula]|uniref:ferroxidase n=1 Tax=Trichodelitschia bisporula TaxID=703511 RepID=A0A6G1I9Z5_9PEZI|nr:Frataxin [Trichodelitschia bisporula]